MARKGNTTAPPKGSEPVPSNLEERAKAIELTVATIEKQFGKGAIMRMGDGHVLPDIGTISTGSIGLDIALGIGGLPRGRIVEMFGPESSGKTTLTLHAVAE